MATVTLLGTQTLNTTSGTHTVVATPAVGDLIVIIRANTGNVVSTTPTDTASGSYTKITSALKASSADLMEVYVRNSLIASATSTTFSDAAGTTTGGGLAVFKVTGMTLTGASAVRQSAAQANHAAGTPAPVFGSAVNTLNPVIGAVFNATSPATMTPRTSFTEAFDVGYSTPTAGLEAIFRSSGETATTMTWGSSSASAFASVAVELNINTAAPTVALNTPADTGTVASTTPQLAFTGTDADSDAISYEVQVDTVNTFDSIANTPAVVQRNIGVDPNGTAGTVTATFINNTAGNTIIVALAIAATSTTGNATPTDTAGNTYTQIASFSNGAQFVSQLWFVANNIAAFTGTNTVTVSPDGAAVNMHIWEVSGLDATSPLDESSSHIVTSGTSLTSNATATTTVANELLIGLFCNDQSAETWTLGTGYSNLSASTAAQTNAFSSASEEQVVSATGTYSATITAGHSVASLGAIMTFRGAILPAIDATSTPQSPILGKTTIQQGTGSPITTAVTMPTMTNGMLLVPIFNGGTAPITSITYNGVALTQAEASAGLINFYYLLSPPAGTFNLVITRTNDSSRTTSAYAIGNVDQVTPISSYTASASFTTSSTPSTSLVVSNSSSLAIDVMSYGTGSAQTITAMSPSSKTQLTNGGATSTPNVLSYLMYPATGTASYGYTISATTNGSIGGIVINSTVPNPFADITNSAHTDPFTSGEQIGYTTTALTNGSTYYWRVRGKDPSGTNSYGAWATTRSFTVSTGGGTVTTLQTIIGNARITATTTQNITGNARVAITTTRVIVGNARITLVTPQTIAGNARITATTLHSITGNARITATTAQNITGNARITITTTQNIAGNARIGIVTTRDIIGNANILATTTKNQLGNARITATTTQNIAGNARITITTDQTISGNARITLVTSQVIVGNARITASTPRNQTGNARITATTTQNIIGNARITISTPQNQVGNARITASTLQLISGNSRITVTTTRDQIGNSRITIVTQRTQTGNARITVATPQNQLGNARVTVTTLQIITGNARVTVVTTRGQIGNANIIPTPAYFRTTGWGTAIYGLNAAGESLRATALTTTARPQIGNANILATTTRGIVGNARITVATTRDQIGNATISSLVITTTRDQIGNANIFGTTTRGQIGNARIQLTTTQSIIGNARITVAWQRNQVGNASIIIAVNRDQIGNARIVNGADPSLKPDINVSSVSATVQSKPIVPGAEVNPLKPTVVTTGFIPTLTIAKDDVIRLNDR